MCEQPTENIIVDNTSATHPDTTPPLGPTPDGAYMTPYRITIFYRTHSVFETAVAALSSRSQLIPISDPTAVDYSVAAAVCEHPTPEILIFGDAFSRADILKFFDRYADVVHIFTYTEAASQQYYDINADGDPIIFDPRVICFGPKELYQHTLIVSNAAAIYLLEHIMCATFDTYKCSVAEWPITTTIGRCLVDALKFKHRRSPSMEADAIGIAILDLCAGVDSFEKIDRLVMDGKLLHEHHEAMTNECLSKGILFTRNGLKYWGINARPTHIQHFRELALVHPYVVKSEADVVLLYSAEHHVVETAISSDNVINKHTSENKTTRQDIESNYSTSIGTTPKSIVFAGWRVIILAAKTQSIINLKSLFTSSTDGITPLEIGSIHIESGMASAWVPTVYGGDLLPFVYTQNIADARSLTSPKVTQNPQ